MRPSGLRKAKADGDPHLRRGPSFFRGEAFFFSWLLPAGIMGGIVAAMKRRDKPEMGEKAPEHGGERNVG